MGLASRPFVFAFCKTTKHSVPSLTSAVETSGAIVRVALFSIDSWPGRNIRFHEVVPAEFYNCGEKPCLIIIDDLLNDAYSKDLCDLIKKGSHQRNISEILA